MIYRPTLFAAFLLIVTLLAIAMGGRAERRVGGALLAAYLVTLFVRSSLATRFSTVEVGVLAVDITLLGLLIWIVVMDSDRWVAWVAAMQMMTVGGHAAKALHSELHRYAYEALLFGWSWMIIALLAFALVVRIVRGPRSGGDSSLIGRMVNRGRSSPQPET